MAVLRQPRGGVRYRIRNQDDESIEHIAFETELSTNRRIGIHGSTQAAQPMKLGNMRKLGVRRLIA
jgi:hypothetical protein